MDICGDAANFIIASTQIGLVRHCNLQHYRNAAVAADEYIADVAQVAFQALERNNSSGGGDYIEDVFQ